MEQNFAVLDKISIAALFVFAAFSMFSISLTQVAAGLGGLAWILRTHLAGTWKNQYWPLGIPFLLYVLACLIAVANAYDINYSYKSLKKLLEILIFFWVLNCIRNNRLRDSLSLVLIASATLAGLLGIYQGWRDGVTVYTRAEGTLSTYMTLAGLLMMVGLLAVGRVLYRHPRESWLWACVGIIVTCLWFTLTRQALFGFFIGLIFFLFTKRKKYILILIFSLFVTTAIFHEQIQSGLMKTELAQESLSLRNMRFRVQRMLSGEDETFLVRVALWKGGWEIFKDYPLTGCGFRCVDLINDQYPDPTGHIKYFRGMHNNLIQLAVDTGILGITAWLGIWAWFFRLLYHRAKALKKDPHECWVIFGCAAAAIAFLAGGCFETNFYDSEVAMVLFFIMALPFAGSQSEKYASGKNIHISSRT